MPFTFNPRTNSKPVGTQQITSLNTVQSLHAPIPDCNAALIQAESQSVRWRDDGGNPSSSVGVLLQAGESIQYTGQLDLFKVIETAASAKLNIQYYKID